MNALVVGGHAGTIRNWQRKLAASFGFEFRWQVTSDTGYKGMPQALPKDCEVVLVLYDSCGHGPSNRVKALAGQAGVRCEMAADLLQRALLRRLLHRQCLCYECAVERAKETPCPDL